MAVALKDVNLGGKARTNVINVRLIRFICTLWYIVGEFCYKVKMNLDYTIKLFAATK